MSASTLSSLPPKLPIGGVLPFSASDWPGRLTATVFTQGCPLRCRYCHNAELQRFTQDSSLEFESVLELLERRRGLLDAVVFSGGEPTAHPDLPQAIACVHELGFEVGLHTCGYSPRRLRRLFEHPATTPDWIGLDVKALPADLPGITGCTAAGAERMWASLEFVASAAATADINVQVRTTVWPGSKVTQSLDTLRERVAELGLDPLVVQVARNVDVRGYYTAP